MAGQCECSECYHVEPLYGYCELIDKNGEVIREEGKTGEIVATGFCNTGMPLIRYKTGDLAEWGFEKMLVVGKSLQLKGVIFTSENWMQEDIEIVQSTFKCKVVSTYGHTERAVFGYIVNGKCTFDKLYGYTELLPTDVKDEYQIACTGFISHKMPLIRYVTDDVVQIQEDGSFKLIGHRKSEVKLIGRNGVEHGSYDTCRRDSKDKCAHRRGMKAEALRENTEWRLKLRTILSTLRKE